MDQRIKHVRSLLASYDEGILTESECDGALFRFAAETLIEAAKRDGGGALFSSWCAAGPPPPPEIHTVSIRIGPDQLQVKRANDPTPWFGDDHA